MDILEAAAVRREIVEKLWNQVETILQSKGDITKDEYRTIVESEYVREYLETEHGKNTLRTIQHTIARYRRIKKALKDKTNYSSIRCQICFIDNYDILVELKLYDLAQRCNFVEAVKMMIGRHLNNEINFDLMNKLKKNKLECLMTAAIRSNNLEVVDFLENCGVKLNPKYAFVVGQGGNIAMMTRCHIEQPCDVEKVVFTAASYNNLEMLKYLWARYEKNRSQVIAILKSALRNQAVDCAEFIVETCPDIDIVEDIFNGSHLYQLTFEDILETGNYRLVALLTTNSARF